MSRIFTFAIFAVAALLLGSARPASADDVAASRFADRLHFFRFEESYADVGEQDRATDWFAAYKKIPLGHEAAFLTLGGDYRYRLESFANPQFGLLGLPDYTHHLNRFMVHADIHAAPALRAFVQFSAFDETGHPFAAGPFDQSEPDVQQAFLDLGAGPARLRIGRQELVLGSGKLTDIREGPNQRQSFDAVRATVRSSEGPFADVFYAQDVIPREEAFSDTSAGATKFWGAYGAKIASPWSGASLDTYYFGLHRPNAIYEAGVGSEERHSIGSRLYGTSGQFSYEYEGIYQFGRFDALDIEAWGVRTEHHYTLKGAPWSPRFGIIANATSGDGNGSDGRLGTFDALFPNPAYTTDASLFRPRNFYELHPVVSFDVAANVSLVLEANFLWRMQTTDAVYAVPGFALAPSRSSDASYIGAIFDVIATWRVSPFVTLQASYVHAAAGDVIDDAGGRDVDFALVQSMIKF